MLAAGWGESEEEGMGLRQKSSKKSQNNLAGVAVAGGVAGVEAGQ